MELNIIYIKKWITKSQNMSMKNVHYLWATYDNCDLKQKSSGNLLAKTKHQYTMVLIGLDGWILVLFIMKIRTDTFRHRHHSFQHELNMLPSHSLYTNGAMVDVCLLLILNLFVWWNHPLNYASRYAWCTHVHINGLVQGRHNTSALAMELYLSCNNPSIWRPRHLRQVSLACKSNYIPQFPVGWNYFSMP